MVVLDPKGDLIDRIAERMSDRRMGDVIMLDAADDERPVGYNPLACTPVNREIGSGAGARSHAGTLEILLGAKAR